MHEKEDAVYAYWMHSAPGMGNRTFMQLLEAAGTPKEVYRRIEKLAEPPGIGLTGRQAEILLRQKKKVNPEEHYVNLSKQGIHFTWIGQEDYPARLRNIPDPPAALYYKGTLPDEKRICVSVVGARECSSYGKYIAEELGRCLAERGVVVASGLARGVDGISQRAALKQGGVSVGVMGCGVDICYPEQNRDIYEMLLLHGAVVSEYVPGTEPLPRYFPQRNRIISGLSDCLVVVEARKKSGTLITVDMALEQGRDVYVVPGRVTDPLSVGCNELLRQGAGVIISVEEFVENICSRKEGEAPVPRMDVGQREASVPKTNNSREEAPVPRMNAGQKAPRASAPGENGDSALSPIAQRVLGLLDSNPKTADELFECVAADGAVSLQELLMVLLELCMAGCAEQIGGSYARTFR